MEPVMNNQQPTELKNMRVFLEKLMIDQPDKLELLLPKYGELMIQIAEFEKKSIEIKSAENIKNMELRAALDTTYSNNNTNYNIAVYQADTDYNINRQNNYSNNYRHDNSLLSQSFDSLIGRGVFDNIDFPRLSRY